MMKAPQFIKKQKKRTKLWYILIPIALITIGIVIFIKVSGGNHRNNEIFSGKDTSVVEKSATVIANDAEILNEENNLLDVKDDNELNSQNSTLTDSKLQISNEHDIFDLSFAIIETSSTDKGISLQMYTLIQRISVSKILLIKDTPVTRELLNIFKKKTPTWSLFNLALAFKVFYKDHGNSTPFQENYLKEMGSYMQLANFKSDRICKVTPLFLLSDVQYKLCKRTISRITSRIVSQCRIWLFMKTTKYIEWAVEEQHKRILELAGLLKKHKKPKYFQELKKQLLGLFKDSARMFLV